MAQIKFYKFKATFWCDHFDPDQDDEVAYGIVAASSYGDALDKITYRLQHIVDCEIKEVIQDNGFFFYDEENAEIVDKLIATYEEF